MFVSERHPRRMVMIVIAYLLLHNKVHHYLKHHIIIIIIPYCLHRSSLLNYTAYQCWKARSIRSPLRDYLLSNNGGGSGSGDRDTHIEKHLQLMELNELPFFLWCFQIGHPVEGLESHKQAKVSETAPTVKNSTRIPNYSAITYQKRT